MEHLVFRSSSELNRILTIIQKRKEFNLPGEPIYFSDIISAAAEFLFDWEKFNWEYVLNQTETVLKFLDKEIVGQEDERQNLSINVSDKAYALITSKDFRSYLCVVCGISKVYIPFIVRLICRAYLMANYMKLDVSLDNKNIPIEYEISLEELFNLPKDEAIDRFSQLYDFNNKITR